MPIIGGIPGGGMLYIGGTMPGGPSPGGGIVYIAGTPPGPATGGMPYIGGTGIGKGGAFPSAAAIDMNFAERFL